jgi:hypothetical protein
VNQFALQLRIEDEEQLRYSIYRTDIGSYALGEALSDEQLYELCRDNGDSKASLKFLVANSSAVVHERNHSSPAASPTVSSMQPPVVIPSSDLVYNRPHPRQRSHSRHGSVSSASERPEAMNGFDISVSDDPNGADAESHRSTLRPPPKPFMSNQNLIPSSLIPSSPKVSRKPTEPRNGSPARSNTRAHSPFLSPDRSGPHSPDARRGRPSPYTPQPQPQPRANQHSPERPRPVCDDRPFSGAPGTPPHGRSGSDGAAKRERPEVHGDARGDERTTTKWKGAAGTKDVEASKLTREPSWVMVDPTPETRLQRVGREPKSSPRFPPSNSALSRSHGIPHMSRQPHAPSPGGDREPRGSGRQFVPLGWPVQWKPASSDPSSPFPQSNLKAAKSMDNLRDKSSQGRSRSGPVPPLPSTPSSTNLLQPRDVTPTSQTMNGDSAGSSSQREVILPPNDPPKPQAEPSRPHIRPSPTNSRPIRPLPQQTPVPPLLDVAATATLSQPRLPFPLAAPSGLSTPTSSTSTLLPAQSDPISRPRSVLDEESTPPHAPRLPRPVDSSVFSEPLQESDMLRSPLPLPHPYRFPPRQLPPPISREDSAPLTTMRALPIPGRTAVTDDRSADARSGSLIDVSSTPANRTPPRSPVSPRSPWMGSVPRSDTAVATNAMSSADISWGHGQGRDRDLIDFNKPPEQTIIQDDNTLRTIQHFLDGQNSEEATMVIKPKTYVLPPIPPPPPLQTPVQTMRNFGFVPPPPPLPKPPPVPIPVGPSQSNDSIYPSTPSTPDQDGSDSEAGTLWQKPMMEDDSLAERPKSTSRGPPLTVKIGQFGVSPVQASQMKSSSSSGGMTLIPNKFPPPPKHPPPSPPLPHWGGRTPTRQLLKEPSKPEATFQDSSWASRPNPEEVLNRLEDFFPDHDLDKPVIEASSGGTSPTAPESPPAPIPYNGKAADKRSRHKKSIRVVAEEHNLRQDRTSRMQSSSAANVFRKRSTKLWDSRVEEVTPGQITSGMPSIPDSPSASGTPAPKRQFFFTVPLACAVAYFTRSQPSSNGFGVSSLGRAISVAST